MVPLDFDQLLECPIVLILIAYAICRRLLTYLYTIDDVELSIVIDVCDIACLQPSILRLGLLGGLRVPPVSFHYVMSSNPDLTPLVSTQLCYAIVGNDFGFAVGIQLPD